MEEEKIEFAVDYMEKTIEEAYIYPDGSESPEDRFETWKEAQEALVCYYQNLIQDAKLSIKEIRKMKPLAPTNKKRTIDNDYEMGKENTK